MLLQVVCADQGREVVSRLAVGDHDDVRPAVAATTMSRCK